MGSRSSASRVDIVFLFETPSSLLPKRIGRSSQTSEIRFRWPLHNTKVTHYERTNEVIFSKKFYYYASKVREGPYLTSFVITSYFTRVTDCFVGPGRDWPSYDIYPV